MITFKKSYSNESLCDLERDIFESFNPDYNPVMANVPCDETGFIDGKFVITVEYVSDRPRKVLYVAAKTYNEAYIYATRLNFHEWPELNYIHSANLLKGFRNITIHILGVSGEFPDIETQAKISGCDIKYV